MKIISNNNYNYFSKLSYLANLSHHNRKTHNFESCICINCGFEIYTTYIDSLGDGHEYSWDGDMSCDEFIIKNIIE